jgi:hypothetical protein
MTPQHKNRKEETMFKLLRFGQPAVVSALSPPKCVVAGNRGVSSRTTHQRSRHEGEAGSHAAHYVPPPPGRQARHGYTNERSFRTTQWRAVAFWRNRDRDGADRCHPSN